jgi:RNA polymerase sigma-70 factor (ECF subfamily)
MAVDERRLIERVIAGDEAAFRHAFRQHTPTMYGVAVRLLAGNVADAEDAVQEAWLRGVRGLSRFRAESSLRTWLVGIAIRCALEICRSRPRGGEMAKLEEASATLPHADLERMDLERVVAALAAGYRHVLVLHDVYGYTHAEIGELLGIDEGTSKSQLSRARQIIRRSLGNGYRAAST